MAPGQVLPGLSAGSLCWFESGVSDSFGPRLPPVSALGWLSGSHCPHYDGEAAAGPSYHPLVRAGRSPPAMPPTMAPHCISRESRLHRDRELTTRRQGLSRQQIRPGCRRAGPGARFPGRAIAAAAQALTGRALGAWARPAKRRVATLCCTAVTPEPVRTI